MYLEHVCELDEVKQISQKKPVYFPSYEILNRKNTKTGRCKKCTRTLTC